MQSEGNKHIAYLFTKSIHYQNLSVIYIVQNIILERARSRKSALIRIILYCTLQISSGQAANINPAWIDKLWHT